MKQKLRMFATHQTPTNLQRTNNLNLRTKWYPTPNDTNRMKSTYSTTHPGKKILLLKMAASWNLFFCFETTTFASSNFPIQPDFSQNQLYAITLNTGSPRTLPRDTAHHAYESWQSY